MKNESERNNYTCSHARDEAKEWTDKSESQNHRHTRFKSLVKNVVFVIRIFNNINIYVRLLFQLKISKKYIVICV